MLFNGRNFFSGTAVIMEKKSAKNKQSENHRLNAGRDVVRLIDALDKAYPDAHCSLDFRSPLQLLIATILSAQCTDKRVNMVTPVLFKRYKTATDFAAAKPKELEEIIRSTGFFRNKSKNIIACCQKISADFGGRVPDDMEDLITLPGVARKTANVVLYNAYGKNEGIAVDTHVTRVAARLGLTVSDKPPVIEQDLMKIIPRDQWGHFSHLLIELGRDKCKAPVPDCQPCTLKKLCPWYIEIIQPDSVR